MYSQHTVLMHVEVERCMGFKCESTHMRSVACLRSQQGHERWLARRQTPTPTLLDRKMCFWFSKKWNDLAAARERREQDPCPRELGCGRAGQKRQAFAKPGSRRPWGPLCSEIYWTGRERHGSLLGTSDESGPRGCITYGPAPCLPLSINRQHISTW